MKKLATFILCILLSLSLSGCWDYRGLNEMLIITAMGIDKGDGSEYKVILESIDLSTNTKEEGIESNIVISTGKTLFDAIRNAKRRSPSKLYFGNMQTVIISEELAKKGDLFTLVDFLSRDSELRDTLNIVIAKGQNAEKIITSDEIIENDHKVSASTCYYELYKLYNTIYGEGKSVSLPSIATVKNLDEETPETQGIAVFKGEKLTGYLNANETKYALFIKNKIKGGVIAIDTDKNGDYDTTLEIIGNKTKTSVEYINQQVIINLDINSVMAVAEEELVTKSPVKDRQDLIKAVAEEYVTENINSVLEKVKKEYSSDIFGFGKKLYKKDLHTWKEIRDNWDELFSNAEINTKVNITLSNAANMK